MRKSEHDWLQLLTERGVLREGHFLLTSGRHTDRYLQCALLFQKPCDAEQVGKAMAKPFQESAVDVVVSPAIGGIVAAHEVARALGCRSIFAERDDRGGMTLRRGFQLSEGERAVVVEDVVTTGGSVKEVLDVVERAGAHLVGITSVVNRNAHTRLFNYPYHPLVTMPVDTYDPVACPLCAAGVEPLVRPGSRKG